MRKGKRGKDHSEDRRGGDASSRKNRFHPRLPRRAARIHRLPALSRGVLFRRERRLCQADRADARIGYPRGAVRDRRLRPRSARGHGRGDPCGDRGDPGGRGAASGDF